MAMSRVKMNRIPLFCLFFVVLSMIHSADGMHEVISVNTVASLIELDDFFFIGEGTFEYNMTINSAYVPLDFLIVGQTSYQFNEDYRSCQTIRNEASASFFFYHRRTGYKKPESRIGDTVQIHESGTYYFIIANCDHKKYDISIDFYAKHTPNLPFVESPELYLGAMFLPLIPTFLLLMVVWLLYLVIWLINFGFHVRQSNGLHKACTLIPIAFFVSSACGFMYWTTCSFTGEYNLFLYICYRVTEAFSVAYLMYILILASKGWRITRYWLYRYDNLSANWVLIAVFIIYFAFMEFSSFYLFIWIFELIIVLRIIFPSSMKHIAALSLMEEHLRNSGVRNIQQTSAYRKRSLFRKLQHIGNTYIVMLFLTSVLSLFIWVAIPFVIIGSFQLLHLTAAGFMGWVLRLRNFSRYNSILDDRDRSSSSGKKSGKVFPKPEIDEEDYHKDVFLVDAPSSSGSGPFSDLYVATPMT